MPIFNRLCLKQKFALLYGFVSFVGVICLVLAYQIAVPLEPASLILMGLLAFNICGVIALAVFISGATQASTKKVISAMGELEEGNLEQRLEVHGKDEMAQLCIGFNALVDKIQPLIEGVSASSHKLYSTASETSAISSDAYEYISQQQLEIEKITSAIEKIAATGFSVGMNASSSMERAEKASQDAEQSRKLVDQTVDSISSLASEVEKSSNVIDKVEDDVKQIGKILVVIRDVSDQTNLLALNAAIEAARVGEMGRGFAVVADEVRSLAKRTQDSTHEIQEMINNLQSNARDAVTVMTSSREKVSETVMHAAGAGVALEQITVDSDAITTMSQNIVDVLEGQNQMITGLGENLVNIGGKITSTTASAKQTVAASSEMARNSVEMQNLIQCFNVNSPPAADTQISAVSIPEAAAPIVEAAPLEETATHDNEFVIEEPMAYSDDLATAEPTAKPVSNKSDDMDFFI
ncbi:MAG: methyl-accepting chemotaxis protein [Gammaproteobacteria bacterium]|nr:methyl-accepting chemotaxis protein [Gammaproteobacteria bacterium]